MNVVLPLLCCTYYSAISLAEEFEQLDNEKGDSPPVVLHLQPQSNDETSLDQSPVHSSRQDDRQLVVAVGQSSSSWSPVQNHSPLLSPSCSNSCGLSPYLESPDDSRESPIPQSHDNSARLYRSHDQKLKQTGSHDQLNRSHDRHSGLHDQYNASHDQYHGSHDELSASHNRRTQYQTNKSLSIPYASDQLYGTPESSSCPNLSMLQMDEHHLSNTSGGMSAVWDDHYHDNCASVDSIPLHVKNSSGQHQHAPSARRSALITTLPAVTEESGSFQRSFSPASHIYKVMFGVASCCMYIMLL